MKKIFAIMVAFALSMSVAACSSGSTEGTTSPAETAKPEEAQSAEANSEEGKNGELVLGLSADYPPFEFYDLKDGAQEIVGVDIMIAQEIAKDMGKTLVIKDMGFDVLIGALEQGQVDIVLAGMHATAERKEKADFSIEYYDGNAMMLVRKGDEGNYATPESFAGKKVGAQLGTIQLDTAKEILEPAGAEIVALEKINDLVAQLGANLIDGLIIDEAIGRAFIEKNAGKKNELAVGAIELPKIGDGVAAAMPKGSDLVDQVNATLERLMAEGKIDEYMIEMNELSSSQ